ncbi:transcription antitermination factor NusB [Aquihabitans sp. McL0605]|uniref:transcription antitermination factor NusB n=1 Tax=Aquihabitans sp. McL0605 TaxID=3415671 RepID=UPI003CF8A9F8
MTDSPELPFLPPGLSLGDDDVIEHVEELEVEIDETTDLEPVDADDEIVDDGEIEVVEADAPRVSGFDGVGTRRESRERALALLYEAEQKGIDPPAAVLDDLPVAPEAYAAVLVVGVSDHLAEIDELIGRYSVGWTVVRMPAVDRTLLRLATFELAHTDVPVGACISEAVELAKRYSTDESHTFVNGLLSRLAAELR